MVNPPDRKRTSFYSERVYSVQAVAISARMRKSAGESGRWSIDQVIGEVLRVKGHCNHVPDPKAPVSVFGFPTNRLQEYGEKLQFLSSNQTEPYFRKGRAHVRRIKKTTPTLLSAVASYPEPDGKDTEKRRRWVGLVVEAAQARWGKRLRSVVAHEDEAFYHLHLLVDNVGGSVKQLHMGFAAADAEPDRSKKGEAYRRGCRAALDWYQTHVADAMGWIRKGPSPRPRLGRARATAMRQAAVEAAEASANGLMKEAIQAAEKAIEQKELQELQRRVLKAKEERLRQFELELVDATVAVRQLRELLKDQKAAEKLLDRVREGRPLPAILRKILGG